MSRFRHFVPAGALIATLLLPLAACDNGPATTDDSTPTSPTTSPVTETFSTQLFVGGTSSRSFTAVKAGTATVTLTNAGGSSSLKLGFGIGVPDTLGSGCLFTRSSEDAVVGTSYTLPVDAGTYCVRVYDIGQLTSNITFTITITRP